MNRVASQLTLRGFDADLARRPREASRVEGRSLNHVAIRLLRRGAGLPTEGERPGVIGADLDEFAGGWSPEDAREFHEALRPFDRADRALFPRRTPRGARRRRT